MADDPAYFGGYVNENYLAIQKALNLSAEEIYKLAENSFQASFLNHSEKREMERKLEEFRKSINVK
jgi:adenosine deaminase